MSILLDDNRSDAPGRDHDLWRVVSVLALAVLSLSTPVRGQGTIHGTVTASSGGSPADGEVSFVGYLADSDDEIRIEASIGAGYESGHWFDDFQNFLGEAPGIVYAYRFYATAEAEGTVLSGAVPDNSFQEEDVVLQSVAWPEQPIGLAGSLHADSAVLIWSAEDGLSYHVYRRQAPSVGSFFRVDVTPDNTADPGVTGGSFTDYDIQLGASYDYVLIADDGSGDLSPHSEILTLSPGAGCCVIRGDVDHSGLSVLDIADLVALVNYMFQGGEEPFCLEEADANADGSPVIDIADLVYLVSYMFQDGPGLEPCP